MSFGWKRKVVQVNTSTIFDNNDNDDSYANSSDLHSIKRIHFAPVETEEHFLQIKEEGERLAEREKFVEAVDNFSRALRFKPNDATLLEMISQVQQRIGDDFAAVVSAEKAIAANPVWSVGYQTLGRAHVNIGETKLALLNFSKALHLNPSVEELRNDEIPWVLSLCKKSTSYVKPLAAFEKAKNNVVRVRDVVL